MALVIGEIISQACRMVPDEIAGTLGEKALTFRDLDTLANQTANALRGMGVQPGDHVAWWVGPSLRTLSGFVACARLAAVFAPLNPAYTAAEASAVLAYVRPRLVVADPVHASGAEDWPLAVVDGAGPGADLDAPLFHYGGWHYLMEAWQNRAAFHLVHRAHAAELVDVIERRRPSALYCIPGVWERLLDPEHRAADLSSLHHADTGTSGVSPELVERIKERLPGTTTTILYGSTEAGRMAALQDWDLPRKPRSVGIPAFPGALWTDEAGEVWVRGETLMSGYLDHPAQTAAALVDGCYRSGDVGHLDDEGYLFLTGRRSELIRTGGEFVAPAEVEAVLRDLPGVADLAVVGLPDDTWGEVVCAVVVLAAGAQPPDVAAVRAHVGARLATFKHPRRVAVLPAIPRTAATGQVQRARIRDWLS